MHYGGFPCVMDEVAEFAQKYGLWLIEDAAHAPGASWQGIPCGRWGDIGCFSFFGNKNLTCAEGGMLVTDQDEIAERLRALRSHGMTSLTWDRYQGHSFSYDVIDAGYNYRIDDLRAALLRVQLDSLDRLNRLRWERVDWYRRFLGRDSRWLVPFEGHPGASAFHLFVVVLAEEIPREIVMQSLRNEGIQTSIHYPPIHQFAFYRKLGLAETDLGVTEDFGRRAVTLPLYPSMTREQVKLVCDAFLSDVGANTSGRGSLH
jgi:dTDP-4-amino-4,6-dideoxygalactose transaminase